MAKMTLEMLEKHADAIGATVERVALGTYRVQWRDLDKTVDTMWSAAGILCAIEATMKGEGAA